MNWEGDGGRPRVFPLEIPLRFWKSVSCMACIAAAHNGLAAACKAGEQGLKHHSTALIAICLHNRLRPSFQGFAMQRKNDLSLSRIRSHPLFEDMGYNFSLV